MSENESSFLTAEMLEKVQLFGEMSGITDENLCIQILQSHNMDVERAISEHLGLGDVSGGGGGVTEEPPTNVSSGPVRRSRGSSSSGNNRSNSNTNTSSSGSSGNTVARSPVLDRFLHPIRMLFTTRVVQTDYRADAQVSLD